MENFMPKTIQDEMNAARLAGMRRKSRLRVHVGEKIYPVLHLWRDGFSVEEATVPPLRGLVDLYDGAEHLYQCLIVASEADLGEMRYEFKRSTLAHDTAPLDFYRDPKTPVAYLPGE